MKYKHRLEFKVRDYECDIQGVVNNAVYQNYLEHARHEWLLKAGINFAKLALKKINLVVIRVELDYKWPLLAGEEFYIETTAQQISRIRFKFQQNICRSGDNKLILQGKIIGASLNQKGRPAVVEELVGLFA